jgi:hypothetical protein
VGGGWEFALMTRTRESRGSAYAFEEVSVGVRARYRRREEAHVIVFQVIFYGLAGSIRWVKE